jgi:cellulose synthase/poly-beta-1,6-N-acetylglucosamine synthase-like glycosyltransferase
MKPEIPARVLIVIATLGQRPTYLRQTIKSITAQPVPADMVLVAPMENPAISALSAEFGIAVLPDPGSLPAAINLGASALQSHHEYINWLNDDDFLEPDSLPAVISALDSDPRAVVAFGHCRYVNAEGTQLWVSKAGKIAPLILSWGPDLIPQPGMLVRASAWAQVGGVDPSFNLAFDLDLLLRLKKIGHLKSVDKIVSNFRWHPDSLTVDDRSTNLAESERAKRQSLPAVLRPVSRVWDIPVRLAIRVAANRVSARINAS